MAETVTISKKEYNFMVNEIKVLKNTSLYQRLLEFEKNICEKEFTRADLGF